MLGERESRQKFEKSQREGIKGRWESLRKLNADELHLLREQQKVETEITGGHFDSDILLYCSAYNVCVNRVVDGTQKDEQHVDEIERISGAGGETTGGGEETT